MKILKSKMGYILIVIIVVAYFGYSFFNAKTHVPTDTMIDIKKMRDDFDSIDKNQWYAGEWLTHHLIRDKISVVDGVVSLAVNQNDKAPYLLSKPFELGDYDIIKIKRRVKLHYGSDYFVAGMVVFESDNNNFTPKLDSNLPFGDAVVMVEYAHDFGDNTKRPGEDVIRIMAPDWQVNDNFELAPIVYDTWFTEELIIDNSGKITYTVNDQTYQLKSSGINAKYFRIWQHGFGAYTGHNVEIDWIEITMTSSENEALEDEY